MQRRLMVLACISAGLLIVSSACQNASTCCSISGKRGLGVTASAAGPKEPAAEERG